MGCHEWIRLIDRYSAALKLYNQAVTSAGGLKGVDFERALEVANERKRAARAIESQMEEHERVHGCTGRSSVTPAA